MDLTTSRQTAEKKRGALSIFVSYFPGTGAHRQMLQEANRVRREGSDVVIGALSDTFWSGAEEITAQFERLPVQKIPQRGGTMQELDLDACLKRHPDLILIDDLSHLNTNESRHMRRYQDVEELLKAGIDVYTTLDISHIESIQEASH